MSFEEYMNKVAQDLGFGSYPMFKYIAPANEADSNSLRCCHGIAEAPRCPDKADWLTLDTADQWDGQAWCQGHRPVKQKPGCQWWVPLRAVRVER